MVNQEAVKDKRKGPHRWEKLRSSVKEKLQSLFEPDLERLRRYLRVHFDAIISCCVEQLPNLEQLASVACVKISTPAQPLVDEQAPAESRKRRTPDLDEGEEIED